MQSIMMKGLEVSGYLDKLVRTFGAVDQLRRF